MRTKAILVAEDEPEFIQPIRARLESAGEFHVEIVATADEALRRIATAVPHALLLDTTLPDRSAQEVCRMLRSRARTAALPCIMLGHAARGVRTVEALSFGADDFVMKPFDPIELEARLRAVLRRTRPEPIAADAPVFHGTHLEANFADIDVSVDGHAVSLSRRELLLLHALVAQCNRTLSREALLSDVWGSGVWDCRVVDSAIWKLRKKLKTAGSQIQTVIGFGYRFHEPRETPVAVAGRPVHGN